MTAGIRPTL